jgi:hypothetical protein
LTQIDAPGLEHRKLLRSADWLLLLRTHVSETAARRPEMQLEASEVRLT